jgi:arylsulfatase A-like enzyme
VKRSVRIIALIAVISLSLGLIYSKFKYPIWLSAIELAVPLLLPDRETMGDIEWDGGTDPLGRDLDNRPPNVVLILADDLGWNDITFNGGGIANGTVPTPSIDSIAKEGVNFINGYAANATCAPSRAAILSGRYPTRFGFEFTPTPPGFMALTRMGAQSKKGRIRKPIVPDVDDDDILPYEDMGMPTSEVTIAELLSDQGYHNVHIGKWHVGQTNGMGPLEQGFHESLLFNGLLYGDEEDPSIVSSKQLFDPIDRFQWAMGHVSSSIDGGRTSFKPDRYLTDYYTDQAVKVIKSNKDRPFFLYLAHWAVHTPLQATKEDYEALSHIKTHRERVYAAMVLSLERSVRRVLQTLEDEGLAENTLVLFTSDNGGAPYIGLPEVNKPYRGWKLTFFEGGIHVPFFAKWPGRIPAGTTFADPVHHFDLFATIAAAAGAKLPEDRAIDGADLLPFVNGTRDGVPHRRLFWRSGASQSALVDGWKLNVSDPPGRTWLFDLTNDPTEQNDLSSENPEKVNVIMAALAKHNSEQLPPAWPATGVSAVNIDKDLTQPDEPDDEYIRWSN